MTDYYERVKSRPGTLIMGEDTPYEAIAEIDNTDNNWWCGVMMFKDHNLSPLVDNIPLSYNTGRYIESENSAIQATIKLHQTLSKVFEGIKSDTYRKTFALAEEWVLNQWKDRWRLIDDTTDE